MTPREFFDHWPDFGSNSDVLLLDVREPDELRVAAVDGTLNIPMAQIPGRLDELSRQKTIVVMCHSGVRSMQVAGFLCQQGFGHVVNLDGGIDAWSREVDSKIPTY
ncbi:MAG TPA: rhodanese-like domain-containing protein [Gammaproteobacteria bacterium]|nr:rhodanese-like domain-containing protein [Gammaproteobacteria bacterium]